MTDKWNKCDQCGRFIPFGDFMEGRAIRRLSMPDSHFTREEYETLCAEHNDEGEEPPRDP